MARRGLQAYAVPSAQAGQHSDPSARRDALSGLMTGGFLMAVIVVVVTIVIATPEYAKPAIGAEIPVASIAPAETGALVSDVIVEVPTSKLPTQLKGYRWPVRGGSIANYYDWVPSGQYSLAGRPVHGGLDITWFAGAKVKAAHGGTVVAAGEDWLSGAGFDGPVSLRKERDGKAGENDVLPVGVVIEDGNGYHSIYSNLKNLVVKNGDKVKAGAIIGEMAKSDGRQFMRYELVRMDGPPMRVANSARKQGFPNYARERVDPLAVLNIEANKSPRHDKPPPPADPPRLSDY